MCSIEKYREMNRLAKPGGVVFLGSDHLAELPIAEIAASFNVSENIYNRSVPNLSIGEISEYLGVCVRELNPAKVFINLGDADIKNGNVDVEDFVAKYEWLLYSIHMGSHADIYIVSVLSRSPLAVKINSALRRLAYDSGCAFIDITDVLDSETPDLRMFDIMKYYIRRRPIDFSDAMNTVTV